MLTNVQLGAKAVSSDQQDLGKVHYLVADQQTKELTNVVLEKGFGGREIVVDASMISNVAEDGKALQVDLTEAQMEALPSLIDRRPIDAGPLDRPAIAATPTDSLEYGAAAVPAAAVPLAADEIGGINYVETVNVPDNSIIIGEGSEVEAVDGRLGSVETVQYDPASGVISGVVIKKGFLFSQEVFVPINLVTGGTEKRLELEVNKNDVLQAQP